MELWLLMKFVYLEIVLLRIPRLSYKIYLGITVTTTIIVLLSIGVIALIAWRSKIERRLPPQMRWIYKNLPKNFSIPKRKRRRRLRGEAPGRVEAMVDNYEEKVVVKTFEAALSIDLNPSYTPGITSVEIEKEVSLADPVVSPREDKNKCDDICKMSECTLTIPVVNEYEDIPA